MLLAVSDAVGAEKMPATSKAGRVKPDLTSRGFLAQGAESPDRFRRASSGFAGARSSGLTMVETICGVTAV